MSSGIGEVWREGRGFSAETTEEVVDRSSLQWKASLRNMSDAN